MLNQKTGIISGILTAFLLLIVAVIFFFVQMVALNGVFDSRATVAMVVFGISELVILLCCGAIAGWISSRLIEKARWNKMGSLAVAVFAGTLLGAILSFFSVIVSILVAGIR